jgi:hypothetical protein
MGREPGSGSSDPDPFKKVIEMQNANNSGSGHGPDQRIVPKAMQMHTESDCRVRIKEFLCGPQIRIGPVPYGTVPLLLIVSCLTIYRHTEIKTYTDKLTDRQCRSKGRQTDKQTDVQKVECSNILCILRYIQKDKETNRQINRQYMCAVQEDSGRNMKN